MTSIHPQDWSSAQLWIKYSDDKVYPKYGSAFLSTT